MRHFTAIAVSYLCYEHEIWNQYKASLPNRTGHGAKMTRYIRTVHGLAAASGADVLSANAAALHFSPQYMPYHVCTTHRAHSLRNLLVSGNECGRVFPAGVGPGSPSRDAANWLPSRFSLSVETRRRYGWLRMMVFPGARLFPSPNLVPFGRVAARERQGALSRRVW